MTSTNRNGLCFPSGSFLFFQPVSPSGRFLFFFRKIARFPTCGCECAIIAKNNPKDEVVYVAGCD
jgi:hypothetical protein